MNTADQPTNSVFDDLFANDQDFVGAVRVALQQDVELLEKFCQFVQEKIGQENVVNFGALADALKIHACLDYLAIGVVSGKISKEEILGMIKK
ncbi:MAG: hypothetical protein A2261_02120 [Candidatus Magasanikbacteria bacterium RIFOXYA2_FULL_44_8]|uniref:Uncharacterized protein n=1 Tax=Candidatus Magasanikbacteria bacterium RIFOXYA2_FULL_44_8 TaxID=1798696 RepID=A0A1F6NKS7_9BACT|nr:MAG: hypothetical protein A2261_02120 [Candidatus Magasanikbacteria bacterium RIFOXYA2_FULL_44_8]